MRNTIFSRLITSVASLAALFLLAACSSGGSTAQNSTQEISVKLVKPADSSALEIRLKAELVKRYKRQETQYYYEGLRGGGVITPSVMTNGAMANDRSLQTLSGSSAAPAFSGTNIQEKGVDEGDLVKTDGNYIYLARGSRFLVLNAQPPEQAAILSDIDLQEQISELYLDNGHVTLVTTPLYPAVIVTPAVGMFAPAGRGVRPFTRLYRYDVATPAAPLLKTRYEFPGAIQGSRRINSTIYLITNHMIDLPNPVTPWDYLPQGATGWSAFEEASAKATTENLKRIDALTINELLPEYSRTTYFAGVADAPVTGRLIESAELFFPETGNGTDLSLVIAIDTSQALPQVTSSGVLSAWCGIYMSTEALYLTSGNSWFWIEPVAGVAAPPANPEPWTAIHKFSVTGSSGKPIYRGSGIVGGWINDQFSLGEYNGYLRIGSTRGGWWGEGISNQLAVFSEQSGKLVQTGKVEGIAPGERIYSMRFDRDRGYMVTFRRVDPLFTFDLSDPQNPRKSGEIKVSGFATYIHLIGPNNSRLLTVGQSADQNGRVTGNKLQLFDVSNLANPLLLGEYELGSGWSTALYDYHSFLYYEPLGLLTIPYFDYSSGSTGYSSGLRVFEVNPGSIIQRGYISAGTVSTGYGTYPDTVDRAVIIGTDIYSVAHRSVTIAGAELLNIKKRVQLPEGYWYYALM